MAAALYRTSVIKLSPVGCARFQQCDYNTESHVIKNPEPLAMKRGTGGRSSFSGMVATVFGSSGFVGQYVANRLGKIGTQLILPYRGDSSEMLPLKMVGDLGQVLFQPFQLKDEDSVRKCMEYSNVVINLIGRDWETKNFKFDDVHVKGARLIARLARECGVHTLVHVSALNATEFPEEFMLKGGSKFLSSKWHGENAVLEEFPEAVIFRPADIYGQEDRFMRYFIHGFRHTMRCSPLYKRGEVTEKQPVFVGDVAGGIVAACKDRSVRGEIIQAVGPRRYKLCELVDWFQRLVQKDEEYGYRRIDARFDLYFQMKMTVMPKLVLNWPLGHVHWEKFERENHSDQVNPKIKTLEDLGVTLTKMEDQVPWEMAPWHIFGEGFAESEPPPFPKTVPMA